MLAGAKDYKAHHHIHDATADDLVIVKILTYPTPNQQGTAEVIEVLGKSGDKINAWPQQNPA